MPSYKYTAINNQGESVSGTLNATDRSQLLEMIREKNFYPVKIEEIHESRNIDISELISKVGMKDIAIFCKQFSTMLNAGVSIIKTLNILEGQATNKRFKKVIGEVYDEVQKGFALSEALRNHIGVFPEILINMVEAGEISGSLDKIMDRMSIFYEKEYKLRSKVKSTMIYPIVLSVFTLLVTIFLLTFVFPTFISMFASSGQELPTITRIIIGISDFVRKFWYIIIAGVAIITYVVGKTFKSEAFRLSLDRSKLKIPVVKTTSVYLISARFSRTLSALLSSGIPLLQAMEIVSKVVNNKVVSEELMKARDDIRKGMTLSQIIARIGIFPPMVDAMISIGEESGALDDLLDKTASFYDDEAEVALQRLVTLLEPLLLLVMGLMIGFIVVGMYLPMFEMFKTIQ